jgi:predicted deacylase
MLKIESEKDTITDQRIRWSLQGSKEGPVLVLFVGIHGNEKAGVKAADNLFSRLKESEPELDGSIFVITGNIPALQMGVRFIDTDLNRLWEMPDTVTSQRSLNGIASTSEYSESREIKECINQIIAENGNTARDFIFADLHTTSSKSCGFILLNDTLDNRELARKFPLPQILGIEENIYGTLLSYINNLGYKAIGFEAGAHHDDISVQRSEAFLELLLHNTGIRSLKEKRIMQLADDLQCPDDIPETYYEIRYHKLLDDPKKFKMMSGFKNFDFIEKDTPLAYEREKLIVAPVSGRIFMPLYQNKGHDGFLIIREVSDFWLELSAYFRNSFLNNILKYLPGVSVINSRSFEVDLTIARFLVKNIFHLLGYRVVQKDEDTLICHKR